MTDAQDRGAIDRNGGFERIEAAAVIWTSVPSY
jgi:hypothetical protein